MSYKSEESEDELSIPEEGEEKINIGLYIGGRNKKGERDGRGWAILPNGDQYDGQYRRGKRHGIGLYVFLDGSRYYGQYRCGRRSGRGIFIYPDGSYYEGCWRRNLKHGKGRYCYTNGDIYCGSWYRGLRHGIGIYTMSQNSVGSACGNLRFKGTWRQGVRVGPFQLTYGNDEKCVTLHGTWDNKYPQGPAVFSFDNRYLLMGYFQTPGTKNVALKYGVEEDDAEEQPLEGEKDKQDSWSHEPSVWYAQEMCNYDYALLPQEPVPLPLSDSDLSICSIISVVPEITVEKEPICHGEGEEEDQPPLECVSCECNCSDTSEVECSSSLTCLHRTGDPCAIEIINEKSGL
ncbi:radial spoke head 1 homolog [Musca vetustissima]|uniref:radial spoke head 1 homolog n=1 Tax=Musca vetustissima TaxID=27455 RepID=UPI002AB7800C|nr:radial spoke head 1 homolog [Musca vetustissima]